MIWPGKKITAARRPDNYILPGLPPDPNTTEFKAVCQRMVETGAELLPQTVLAALLRWAINSIAQWAIKSAPSSDV